MGIEWPKTADLCLQEKPLGRWLKLETPGLMACGPHMRSFPEAHGSYYIGYRDTWSSQNLVPSLSFRNAGRLNPLNCTYFDRLQAAVILLKGLLSKYVKLIILKIVALNKRTRGPDLPWNCLNCTKFGRLILRKIISIVATCRRHMLQLKCTKFDFEWGSALDHAGGAYSAPHTPLAGYKGAYFQGKGGEEGRKKRAREWEDGGEGTYF